MFLTIFFLSVFCKGTEGTGVWQLSNTTESRMGQDGVDAETLGSNSGVWPEGAEEHHEGTDNGHTGHYDQALSLQVQQKGEESIVGGVST